MFESGSFSFGAVSLLFGGVLIVAILLLTRFPNRFKPNPKTTQSFTPDPEIPEHRNAVMMIEPGGRVAYINEEAKARFELWEEGPKLEKLARRSRPSDVFWGLCSQEGEAHLLVDGHPYNAKSYKVPNTSGNSMLLSLEPVQDSSLLSSGNGSTTRTMKILTELSSSLTADLEIESVLKAILESVEKLIPTDFSEITLWDSDNQKLIPYRFWGTQGIDRKLEITNDRYSLGEGYSGYVAIRREPFLVRDVETYSETRPAIDRKKYPFQSYLGVPLYAQGNLIGTLELTSKEKNAYSQDDANTLALFAGQIAITIHNSLVFQEEQKRANELSSLANLAKAVSSIRDDKDLFANLVQGISPLLEIDIAGFLIFDETQRLLEAQNPFIGVPPHFVELYKVPIPPESQAEIIWSKQENLVTIMASEDPVFIELGLDHSARAAGIRHCALVPLSSGGRKIGYLQVANKRNGMPFDQDDIRLLEIIATQAAPIIENAELVKVSVGRALRAEALRRIASLTGSAATLDEIFKYSLLELARLLQADFGGIFLLNENLGELRVHEASLYGIKPDQLPHIFRIPIGDENFRYTVTSSKRPFLTGDARSDERVLPVFSALVKPLDVQSVIDVPLVIRERGLGEIILCSRRNGFFSQSDVQLASTVASQLSIAYERSQLASQTDVDLRQRIDQLTSLTRISRELNTSIHLPYLLELVLDESLRNTRADSGTILLFKFQNVGAESPRINLQIGHPHKEILTPIELIVSEKGEPLIVDDFDRPSKQFKVTKADRPTGKIKSALFVPIIYQEMTNGLIVLYAKTESFFNDSSIEIIQALAIQATIAIGNAQQYQEQKDQNEVLNRRIKILSNLFDATQNVTLDRPLETSLEEIAYGIQASTSFNIVIISPYDLKDRTLIHLVGVGIPISILEDLQGRPSSWEDLSPLLHPEYSYGRSYFIPDEVGIDVPVGLDFIRLLSKPSENAINNKSQWKPGDLLFIPLVRSNGEPLGLITVTNPRDNHRPDTPTFETLEIFASQASLLMESHQSLLIYENQVSDLSNKLVEYKEAKEMLPTLIQKDIEQKKEIETITQSTKRINSGLNIIEKINKQPDRLSILSILAKEIISQMNLDVVLVAEPSQSGPHLIHISGDIPESTNPEALFGQRNPLHESLRSAKILSVANLEKNNEWKDSPLLNSFKTAGFFSIPIMVGPNVNAAILAISHSKFVPFTKNDERILEILSHQTGIAINNINILNETGRRLLEVNLLLDFSRQLGSLDQTKILQTLITSSMQVAQNAMSGLITLADQEHNYLVPQIAKGYFKNEAIMQIKFKIDDTLLGEVLTSGESIIIDDLNFAQHYPLDTDNLLLYREATNGLLPVSCIILPIQTGDHALGVIVLDNFRETNAFSREDQALITSLTQQTALTLENARFFQAAENRASQLQALSDVASTITSSLEPDALHDSLLDKLIGVVPFETGTLWLREEDNLVIRSALGFENNDDLIGLSTRTNDSRLFREMTQTRSPISVKNVLEDERFPGTESERLSWLGIPLISKGNMVGVIALEKLEPEYYTDEHIQVVTTFANQAAIALENATLYQESLQRTTELDERSQRLALLNRFSNQISSVLDPGYILETTVNELSRALTSTVVSAVMFENDRYFLRSESSKSGSFKPEVLPNAPVFDRLSQTFGIFNTQDVGSEPELIPLSDFFQKRKTKGLLILPIVTGEEIHGVFLIQNEHPNRYTPDEIELTRIITNQAAIAFQNANSFKATTKLTEELEYRVVERTAQLEQEHLRAQSLLRIMRELSASLDLDQVLNQTLVILNETVGAEQSTILLIDYDEHVFYYRASVGYDHTLPRGGQLSSLKLNEGLAGWVVENRQSALVSNVHEDKRWVPIEDFRSGYNSAIVVPLRVGEEALGVVTLTHSKINAFTKEDQDLAHAAAMQMAVAINNAELFNLIRDQAEGLGTMLRSQQVEASRSMAILEAVANGVLVTDDNNEITLFNDSAQRILEIDRSEILGKSLDTFTGLFGRAAQTWMETIQKWSEDPTSYETGDIYEEQINLDNNTIVSVHLAPVVMGNEFLGTVSIFQDITHQVEVDRLKSEFVATVSHELRTPMTSIKGYVDILLMGATGELTDQQKNFLDIVKTNTERLNILVNDLLDVSRIEAGKVELIIQPLDLGKIITEVVEIQKNRSKQENKSMAFVINIPESLPMVPGDEERIRQILDNIISNAYLYTPENGHITVGVQLLENDIQVDVVDNGIGVHPNDHERIFERFYRGEHPLVLASRGNGLGLSIVRQLIGMHNGRIWLQSKGIPGDGSTFSISLPLLQPSRTG